MSARLAAAIAALGLAACGHTPQLSANWFLVSRLPTDSSAAFELDRRMVVAVLNRDKAPVRITRMVVNPGTGEWRVPGGAVDLGVGELWVINLDAGDDPALASAPCPPACRCRPD